MVKNYREQNEVWCEAFCFLPFRAEKETWIKEKYVEKRFVQNSRSDGARESDLRPHLTDNSVSSVGLQTSVSLRRSVPDLQKGDAGLRLYRAALTGDLVAMAALLAQGSEVNESIGEEEGRTALIGAAVGVRRSNSRP